MLIETPLNIIEDTFIEYTKRKDIAIILINQHVRLIYISYTRVIHSSSGC